LGNLSVDERIILKCRLSLREIMRGCGLDLSGLGKGPVVGCCKHGNEPLVPIKDTEFPD
jgi:hypothetical protein